jgi:hypothetical protein
MDAISEENKSSQFDTPQIQKSVSYHSQSDNQSGNNRDINASSMIKAVNLTMADVQQNSLHEDLELVVPTVSVDDDGTEGLTMMQLGVMDDSAQMNVQI